MSGNRFYYAVAAGSIIAVFAMAIAAPATRAQSSQPQFLMTWRAINSYAPPGYAGKILPNQTSLIAASLEIISSQGRAVNLGGQTIYWYLDDQLLGGGIGVQHFTFRPFGEAPNTLALKVELPDYPGGLLIHEVSIPVVQPQAVIEAPYPQGQFAAIPAMVQALPYFFGVSSTAPLSFAWSVNGQTVLNAENPQTLQISLPGSAPSGFALTVALTIQNANDSTAVTANASLTYQPKP